jgi:hypothetical protein
MPRQQRHYRRTSSLPDRNHKNMSVTSKQLMMLVGLLLICFSVNFCLMVNESSREDTPDFELLAGLTKTFFRKNSEGAPVCDAIHASNITYTLVTQMSIDQFWLANRHCRRWKGPISMAVVTGRKSSEDLMRFLEEKGCNTSQISIEVVQDIHSKHGHSKRQNVSFRLRRHRLFGFRQICTMSFIWKASARHWQRTPSWHSYCRPLPFPRTIDATIKTVPIK